MSNTITKYTFVTKQDIINQLGEAEDFGNLNYTGIDTILGVIANACVKVTKRLPLVNFITLTYDTAKVMAEAESASLRNLLNNTSYMKYWKINIELVYRNNGYTNQYSNGYETYQLDSMNLTLEDMSYYAG
ncbi:hypothetical protein [Clostridium uliginosum]|uniref:Uncharacterized protein n=1 Tax=Clostridium uliginosum TaxID=119641 RepID=A0A1I1IUN5_9CLOT|nr:hypothetical protein [Clostridium uliginosum]SFC39997.1 hypothetical protein SAMN05421842_10384 [Clostridium uliginosum]